MRESAQIAIGVTVSALIATAYVLVHEQRRKLKVEKRRLAAAKGGSGSDTNVLSREQLLTILDESATVAYQLIEQTRKMVQYKHEQTGMSLEAAVDELQKDFESAMEAVLCSIRAKHSVTEQQMAQAMAADPTDKTVEQAVTTLREAMGGKPPPNYAQNVQEQSKRIPRRGRARKKG